MSGQTSQTVRGASPNSVHTPISDTARDKLRSLLVIVGIFAVGGLSTSLVFHNALGLQASIVVLVALVVGSIIARVTHRI